MKEIIGQYYKINRTMMNTSTDYMVIVMIASLIVYFFGKKNTNISLFPLTCILINISKEVHTNLLLKYITSSILRTVIFAHIGTYLITYFGQIFVMIAFAGIVLIATDMYNEFLYMSVYNCILIFIVFILFWYIQKLYNFGLLVLSSMYSSIILLNGLEILLDKNVGMETLEISGILLVSILTFLSLIIQGKYLSSKNLN